MKKVKGIVVLMLMVLALCGNATTVFAVNYGESGSGSEGDGDSGSSSDEPYDQYVSDAWKDQIRGELNRYYSDLKILYDLTDEKIKRMDRIYNSAMSYMKNAGLTMSELTSYEAEIEGYLLEIVKENTSGTEKFLMLSNEVPILDAKFGEIGRASCRERVWYLV